MVFSLRKLIKRIIFILQLIVFTLVAYYVLHLLQNWLAPSLRYKTPVGESVKVFQREAIADQQMTLKQQLGLFYWIGE